MCLIIINSKKCIKKSCPYGFVQDIPHCCPAIAILVHQLRNDPQPRRGRVDRKRRLCLAEFGNH